MAQASRRAYQRCGKRTDIEESDQRADTVRPVNGRERLECKRRTGCGHAELAHELEAVPKIHIGQPYAVTGRKVLTRERCIISGHPPAERDLACHDNESEYRPWPQPLCSSRIRRQHASTAVLQPICMRTAVRRPVGTSTPLRQPDFTSTAVRQRKLTQRKPRQQSERGHAAQ